MSDPTEAFEIVYCDMLADIHNTTDYASDTAKLMIENLAVLVKSRPEPIEPEPTPDPVPETRWGRFKLGTARALDNETTRTLIKAGGSVAGVGLVAYATIRKDHVLERQALDQAHQQQIR